MFNRQRAHNGVVVCGLRSWVINLTIHTVNLLPVWERAIWLMHSSKCSHQRESLHVYGQDVFLCIYTCSSVTTCIYSYGRNVCLSKQDLRAPWDFSSLWPSTVNVGAEEEEEETAGSRQWLINMKFQGLSGRDTKKKTSRAQRSSCSVVVPTFLLLSQRFFWSLIDFLAESYP